MASLKDRLRRTRELAARQAASTSAGATSASAASSARLQIRESEGSAPPGFCRVESGLLRRETRFALASPALWDLRPFMRPADLESLEDPGAVPRERLRFYDLETTGLSGGAGTIAFLAAVGRAEEGGLALTQWLVEDYPAEPALLQALREELSGDAVLVSFNGRSFDMPLTRSRFILNRLRAPEPPHADILPACRRLWRRRLGSCALSDLEAPLLGQERGEDIPGALIPEVFLTWLRDGDPARMREVVDHNARDVASLAALALLAADAHARPLAQADLDEAALGAWLARRDPESALALLRRGHEKGDARAGLALAALLRRRGEHGERDRVLGSLPPSAFTLIELAKRAEHSDRDCARALALAERALSLETRQARQAAIEARIGRLLRKLASRDRVSTGSAPSR